MGFAPVWLTPDGPTQGYDPGDPDCDAIALIYVATVFLR